MAETVNQEEKVTAPEQVRTFTQAELDAIIGDRLKRERDRYADYDALKEKAAKLDQLDEANKSELQKAQEAAADFKAKFESLQNEISRRNARDKVAAETGVPATLLTGDTEEACKAQADAILQFKGTKPNYPNVSDGGETHQTSGGKTRDQFADWFKSQIDK